MFEEELKKNYKPAILEIEEELEKTSKRIQEKQKDMFDLYRMILNDQHELIKLNYRVLNYKNNALMHDITVITYKNLFTINSIIELMKKGYVSSAQIICRTIFESLLLGKMFAITEDYSFYEKWNNGQQISIKKDIFFKLKNEFSKESYEFWDHLNKFNHSTIYSQNFEFEYHDPPFDNINNYISALLEMNYHLLNRFVCKYREYYLDLYFNNFYKDLKKRIKHNIKIANELLDPRCKKVIKDYRSNWKI